jgi:hypothetical protein
LPRLSDRLAIDKLKALDDKAVKLVWVVRYQIFSGESESFWQISLLVAAIGLVAALFPLLDAIGWI